MPGTITWYAIDSALKTVDRGAVSLGEALGIAERYYGNAGRHYQTGEEAIAETVFGFVRQSDRAFIEFCVNGKDQIAYKIEIPAAATSRLAKLLGRTVRVERNLDSWSAMAARIEEFFTLSPQSIATRLQAGP